MAKILLGIDEVGRGCLAGPLYAAAVILKNPINGLNDSKLLSRDERERLYDLIYNNSLFVGIGVADSNYIDKYGLTKANSYAMEQALRSLKVEYDKIIIDGNYNYLSKMLNVETMVKADQKCPAVSAASIIAKVSRDRLMFNYDKQYPGYGFINNVGYPTKQHYLAIEKIGLTPIHRKTFKLFR